MTKLDTIHTDIRPYAEQLIANGFTVYAATDARVPLRFFHYSREVEGQTCYGTVTMTEWEGPEVHMPRTPSRERGSAVRIADRVTLETMTKAASPMNRHYWEPRGYLHQNARPWGVPDTYAPVEVATLEA